MRYVLACVALVGLAACGDDTYNYDMPEEVAPPPGVPVVSKPTPTPAPPTVVPTPEPTPECTKPRRCKDHDDDEDTPKCC